MSTHLARASQAFRGTARGKINTDRSSPFSLLSCIVIFKVTKHKLCKRSERKMIYDWFFPDSEKNCTVYLPRSEFTSAQLHSKRVLVGGH